MRPDAFTLGNPSSYDAALLGPEPPRKLGRFREENGDVYEGGCVFRTREDAESYLSRHPECAYRVYGLVLPSGWDEDVHLLPGEEFFRLLNDAPIVAVD